MTSYYRNQYRNRGNKYGVSPAASRTYNCYTYDSKKEAGYAQNLDILLKAKEIKDWSRQVPIKVEINGKWIFTYKVDFMITYNDDSLEYIEIKGMETPYWKLKFKIVDAINSGNQDLDGHGEGAIATLNIEPHSILTVVK